MDKTNCQTGNASVKKLTFSSWLGHGRPRGQADGQTVTTEQTHQFSSNGSPNDHSKSSKVRCPHLMAQFQFSLTTDFQFSAPSLPLSSTFHQRMWKISRFHHKRTTLPVLLHFWSLAAWSSTAESDLEFHGPVQWGSYGTDLAWLPPDLHAAQTTGSRSFHHLKMSTPARKALMSEAWVAGRGRGKTGKHRVQSGDYRSLDLHSVRQLYN